MKKWGVCVICILLLCVIETVPVFASEKNTQDYLGNMTEELDFSKLDHFMRQDAEDSGITFSELVKELLYQEKPGALYQQIGIILTQKQAVLSAACHHSVWLVCSFC